MSLLGFLNNKTPDKDTAKVAALFAKAPPPIEEKPLKTKKDQKKPQPPISLHMRPKKQKKPDEPERTVFIGNLNTETTKKDLLTFMSAFGEVEKLRFRSVPVQENKMSKKANFILGNIKKGEGSSMNAYVTFQTIDGAVKARAQAGHLQLLGRHLRATLEKEKDEDYDTSVFVGNLPFDVTDEQLRDHFSCCGEVVSVRVIRRNGQGIGIGYVRGASKEVLARMRQMNGSELNGRVLRVKKAVSKGRLQKKVQKNQQKHEQYLRMKEENSRNRVTAAKERQDRQVVPEGGNKKRRPAE